MAKAIYQCIFLESSGAFVHVYYPLNIITQGHSYLETFTQNILSLFKIFSAIQFNNLLAIKTKRVNINHEV